MAKTLQHFGILGMKWGIRRRRAEANARAAASGKGVLKPTYQYRDSKGNLVSRYGPGPYGGGPKPDTTSSKAIKSDKKFMSDVNKMSKKISADDMKFAEEYTKNYLKTAGKAIVAGLIVTAAARNIAQIYINVMAVKRYNDFFN